MQNSSESEVSNPNEFSFTVWVKRGDRMVQRIYLGCEDPESVWMLWWNRFEELIPRHMCDQIWGVDCVTEAEYAEVCQRFEKHLSHLDQHSDRLLIEMGAIITD